VKQQEQDIFVIDWTITSCFLEQ